MAKIMRSLLNWLPRLWANWITLLGSVLTTVAGLAVALFIVMDLAVPGKNPYASSFFILFLPMLFIVGLALIPAGLWWDRRRQPRQPGAVEAAFQAALKDASSRNRIFFVAVLTVVNVLLLGFAGKSSVEYMDSPKFCGGTCHSVMQPEWAAYQKSPHSNVACVECHIGSGTTSYVKAKVNGIGQMVALWTKSYHRPVEPPGHLKGDVCVQCHAKSNIGDQIKLYPHYKPDKDNTPAFNALVMHVGGKDAKGDYHGIHWHANPDLDITYQYLDEKRTKIGTIRVSEKGKPIAEYQAPGPPQKAVGERKMDCLDCHNRPTHIFDVSPAAAVDRALADGRLDVKIPHLAQVAAELLQRPDGRRADAEAFFQGALTEAYRGKQVAFSGEQAAQSAKVLAEIYRTNVYPELKLGWGSYRSNLGHPGDTGGCFRCHDKEHAMKLPDGTTKTMSQDCDGCHERVAADEDPKNLDETMKLLLPRS
jgi:nitrate/TMAO reductase-like tetraheme cytochrome c subunit